MFTLETVKHWAKVAFSAEIRLPESRKNLSLTPMYVTMAISASQKARKISKSRILEFWPLV